tara:strand:- start:18 stop:1499 length:1482 start_codon:yes stop_codon:yes gene_type:complete
MNKKLNTEGFFNLKEIVNIDEYTNQPSIRNRITRNLTIRELDPEEAAFVKALGKKNLSKIRKLLEEAYEGVPNYPFKKDWELLGVKQWLLKAINEGKDSISASPSEVLVDRWSPRFREMYKKVYDIQIPKAMKKLAKKYGGKFEEGRLDTNDLYGTADDNLSLADVNILTITPEMREKILKDGLPAYGYRRGGLVNRLEKRNVERIPLSNGSEITEESSEINPYVPFLPDGSPNPYVSDATRAAWDAMDVESEVDIRDRMGTLGRDAVDMKRLTILPNLNWNVKGFYNREKTPKLEKALDKIFKDAGKNYKDDAEDDMVYIVGEQNANPYILGHEFRHRAYEDMSEQEVRLLDAYYARNKKELNAVLEHVAPDDSRRQQKLLDIITENADELINRELNQLKKEHDNRLLKMEEKNISLPDTYREPDWDLEKERLVEQYNRRAKNTGRREVEQIKSYQYGETGKVVPKRKPFFNEGGLVNRLQQRNMYGQRQTN